MAQARLRDLLELATALRSSGTGLTIEQMMSLTQRSRRTVERMLDALRDELGIEPQPSQMPGDHHRRQRWRIERELPGPLVQLTEGEQLALQGLATALPHSTAKQALMKLLAAHRTQVATGLAVDAAAIIDRTAHITRTGAHFDGSEALIGSLEQAILNFERVKLTYLKDGETTASTQTVKPLGFVFGRFGYLVAHIGGKGLRIYRLNCIFAAEATGMTFAPLAWFDLKRWAAESFGIYHGDELRTYRIVFSPSVARRAEGVSFHPSESKRRLPDGSLEVTLRCKGERELMHELAHPDWYGAVEIR